MTPILYENTETEFKTQGLGALIDAITCTVTEERNGSFELEMTYPIEGLHYADIQYGRIILAKPAADAEDELFEIYKITRPISGKVTIYAQHISYRLSYTATAPCEAQTSAQAALNALKTNAASTCPFVFSSDVIKEGTFSNDKTQSIRSLLGGQDGSVLDVFGGEYKWNRWNVSLLTARGETTPVILDYGKNITDLQQEENISSTYTAVVCTWSAEQEDGSVQEVHGALVYTDNKDLFPYTRTLVVDKSSDYESAPTIETLTQAAANYITANSVGTPKVSVKVSFVNLRDTEEYKDVAPLQSVHLCDTIKVRFERLGVNASAKVITTEYDVLNERYDSIEVGDSKSSLASTIASSAEEIETTGRELSAAFKAELNRTTQVITGGMGGYVIIRRDETTGYPDEILIMDQPDKETATNVIRMNKNGIGFSQSGYNGPFNSAWLIDGTFDAAQIKTGILSDAQQIFYLDMDSGKLVMKSGEFSGELACNKTGHGASTGTGLYADKDGISVGQVVGSYGNMPVFSVSLTNGDSTPIRTTGLGFRHSDGSDFGYMYAWGTESSDGPAMSSGHLLEGGVGKGCCFNRDIGISGRFFANGISSSGPLCAAGILKVGGGGDTEINKASGGNVYLGYLGGGESMINILSEQKVIIKSNLDMNNQYILNVGGYGDISDVRVKKDIESIDTESSEAFVMALRPVRYKMKGNPRQRFGFIAQEVQSIDDKHADLVIENDEGLLNLSYTEMIADLVNVVQNQEKRIAALEEIFKNGEQ